MVETQRPTGQGFTVVPDGITAAPPCPLSERIERLVLYYDVFHHPLTMAELERFTAPGGSEAVERACAELVDAGRLAAEGPYRFVPGRAGSVARRRDRAMHAELRWPAARWASNVLAQLPWVHGVMVTGGLSKGSAEADDDVDFLLLVEPGSVWTLKSFLQLVRKSLPPGPRSMFCTNYIVDVDHLLLDDRNLFTAVELATAVPMAGPEACSAFVEANQWATHYVPGLRWSLDRARLAPPVKRSRVAQAIERQGTSPRALETTALRLWDGYWNKKYAWLAQDLRRQRFKRRTEIATNHLHDFQAYVLREVGARYERAGLAPW